MPIPSSFNATEHLQSVVLQVHNRIVKQEFSDTDDDDDISTPRSSLKQACLLRDDDSLLMMMTRYCLFYFDLRKASDLQAPLYTIPTAAYQQSIKFAPQVLLYFKEDISDVEEGYSPIEAEISFRLPNETSETYNESKARTLGNKIKAEFATSNGYRWKKGRVKLSYRDPEEGYQLVLNVYNEAEGKQVLNKVLDLQNHVLDSDKLAISQLDSNPPTVPPTRMIYGRSRRLPRKRPVGFVRFTYAELHLWGMPNAVTLIDLSGRRRNPLVST